MNFDFFLWITTLTIESDKMKLCLFSDWPIKRDKTKSVLLTNQDTKQKLVYFLIDQSRDKIKPYLFSDYMTIWSIVSIVTNHAHIRLFQIQLFYFQTDVSKNNRTSVIALQDLCIHCYLIFLLKWNNSVQFSYLKKKH